MKLLDLAKTMDSLAKNHNKRIVTLNELAVISDDSKPALAMSLLRGEKQGLVWRLRYLWINRLNPPALEEIALSLAGPSYISFESALYKHGILSQSPRGGLTMATPGRSAHFASPLGPIRFIHLKNSLFSGFDADRLAYAEKAFLDLVYIRAKHGLGREFTETLYLEELNRRRLKKFAQAYPGWTKKSALNCL